MQKVLIANRGEIAVRVARACRDHGLTSVAVYAEPDRDALHVKVADEAYALGGNTAAESYLRIEKLIEVAKQAGVDGGPPRLRLPLRERRLRRGRHRRRHHLDRSARRTRSASSATRRRPGTSPSPSVLRWPPAPPTRSAGPTRSLAFADEHGLPIAIKAAFGGGGRGLKVAYEREEVSDLYDSAVREAVAAFGRGECFVERYLDRPRHVETQVLADGKGKVVVVGTRDCSLQRRYQKLVEEAPAPFLTEEQRAEPLRGQQEDLPRGRLRRCGHRRVPRRRGRPDLLPRGQHPSAGRAPGDRRGHRRRPRALAVPDRRRRAAHARGPAAARPRLRVPHQRRGPGAQLPARRPAPSPPSTSRSVPASASTPACRPATSSAASSTRCSPS